jgi:hypothetical protein
VLDHLRKNRFPKGEYNKVKLKFFFPCKILRKFSANAYELELPKYVGISPILNVADAYHYHAGEGIQTPENNEEEKQVQWKKQLPATKSLVLEKILHKRLSKKTRGKEYFEYLVKWKDHPVED